MLRPAARLRDSIECDGFAVVENFASSDSVESLASALGNSDVGERAGTRQLHQRLPAISAFLRADSITRWIEELVPGGFPVRSILFDKTAATNWGVAWHQDLSICVKERHDVPGFTAWSVKDGVAHVQPPISVLERMLTLRLHLDDCRPDNGPLRVIPGSHRHGRASAEEVTVWRNKVPIVTCAVLSGGAVVMKPLVLHSSSPATNPSHRRVLHVEFASEALPQPLEWIS